VPEHSLYGLRRQACGRTTGRGRGAAVQGRGAQVAAAGYAGVADASGGRLLDWNAFGTRHQGRRHRRCGGGTTVGYRLDGTTVAFGNRGRRRWVRALIGEEL